MVIHKYIEPDCPNCGREMSILTQGNPPFTQANIYGSTFSAWYECPICGFTTEKATMDHRSEAKAKARELASEYMPKE